MRVVPRRCSSLSTTALAFLLAVGGCSLLSPLDFLGDGVPGPSGSGATGPGGSAGAGALGGAGGGGGTAGSGSGGAGAGLGPPSLVLHTAYTRHLGRWVGRGENVLEPIGAKTFQRANPFLLGDKLAFFLTDVVPVNAANPPFPYFAEAVAWTTSTTPPDLFALPKLNFYTHKVGGVDTLQAISAANVDQGLSAATGAVTVGDKSYLFIATDFVLATISFSRAVLVHGLDENFNVTIPDFSTSTTFRFLGSSPLLVEEDVYIFGSSATLGAPIYLAKVPAESLGNRAAWQFFSGYEDGKPKYQPQELLAVPIFEDSCVTDPFVAWHPELKMYLMTYWCDGTIRMRTALTPDGQWSDPIVLVDQLTDAFGIFVHNPASVAGFDDGLSDLGSEGTAGFVYGAYLVPQWFSEPGRGLHSLKYVVSTANPFTVSLVETVLAEPGFDADPPIRGQEVPITDLVNGKFTDASLAGWTKTQGGDFTITTAPNGDKWFVTTNAGTGRLSQSFKVDSTKSQLTFSVRGLSGNSTARVRLLHGNDEVRTTRGTSLSSALEVVWNIQEYRGETVTLEIIDEDASNRIEVGPFTLL